MFLNHARPPWAGLDWEPGVSATGSRCTAAPARSELESQSARPWNRLGSASRSKPCPGPALRRSPTPSSRPEPPRPAEGVTFAVELNGGAWCWAGGPGTEVDRTALQHSRLASVSLGCSHQHADPAEGNREAVHGVARGGGGS